MSRGTDLASGPRVKPRWLREQEGPARWAAVERAGNLLGALTVANAIEALYGFYYNPAWSTQSGAQSSNSAIYSGFQLAIWEMIYDGASDSMNPNSNNFFTTGNFTAQSSSAESEAD